MAWQCSGTTNKALVENLQSHGIIRSMVVFNAMMAVDRGNYAPRSYYEDSPQPIGYKATISAPHMHASALEYLAPFITKPDARVLDVGCGCGYFTVLCARANPTARVLGLDYIPQLVDLSQTNTAKEDSDLLTDDHIRYVTSNGWDLSLLEAEELHLSIDFKPPYDAIHVGAAAESLPQSLLNALKVGGRMIIPVGPDGGNQELLQVDREGDSGIFKDDFKIASLMGVRYVPLSLPTMRPCGYCGNSSTQICSQCKSISYCNTDHQKLHWSAHKLSCKKIKAEREQQHKQLPLERPFEEISEIFEAEKDTRRGESEISSQKQSKEESSRTQEGGTKRSCRCMFCGDELVLGSEEEAVMHMETCPALQEQLNDSRQFTLPESIKPTVFKK